MYRCKGVGGRHAETGSRGVDNAMFGEQFASQSWRPSGTSRERLYVARGRYSAGAIGRARCGAAIAKTIAELTSQQEGFIRQQVIEQLMRQIMHYDVEFRREEATSAVGSNAKH